MGSPQLAEHIARMLTDVGTKIPRSEFERLLERLLSDSDPQVVAQIAQYLPVTASNASPKAFALMLVSYTKSGAATRLF